MRKQPDAIADWVVRVEGYDRAAVESIGVAELSQLVMPEWHESAVKRGC